MQHVAWLILGIYCVAWFYYLRAFQSNSPEKNRIGAMLLNTAVLCHAGLILWMTVDLQRVPVASVPETLGTFVFLTAMVYRIMEARLREYSMSAFLLPVLVLLYAVALLSPQPESIPDILTVIEFEIHVIFMILAYGAFAVAFIASAHYLLLNREIRKKTPGIFYSRLPSLPFFERIGNWSINIGLLGFTIGLLIGLHAAYSVWGNFHFSDPKFIVAYINWALYGLHYIGRKAFGWRGRKVALLSVVGFIWMLFSFVVVSLLFTRVHDFN